MDIHLRLPFSLLVEELIPGQFRIKPTVDILWNKINNDTSD